MSRALSPDTLSRRTVIFVNIARALDHFALLVYPTAVIAMAPARIARDGHEGRAAVPRGPLRRGRFAPYVVR